MNEPLITLLGRLTRDPEELRYTTDRGTAYTRVGVAVNTYHGPSIGEKATYYQVTLWGRHAENAVNRCRKGTDVFVHGAYDHREYTRQDGTKGCSHDVNCRDFRYFLNRSADQEGEGLEERTQEEQQAEGQPANEQPTAGDDEEPKIAPFSLEEPGNDDDDLDPFSP